MAIILSKLETNDLKKCEQIIESGLRTFADVGNALATIRENRLYRAGHETFEAYCKERWGFTSSRARQLVAAAEVTKQFPTVTNERQARVVTSVPEDQREEVVRVATEIARGTSPTVGDFAKAREQVVTHKTATATNGNANFIDAKASFAAISKELGLVNEMFETLLESRHAAFLVAGEVRADMKNLRAALKFAAPEDGCPECEGNGCETCRQQGWVSVGVARHLVKESK